MDPRVRRELVVAGRQDNSRVHGHRGRPSSDASRDADGLSRASFVEFSVDDPAALDQEWNYTDRADRLYQAGHRLFLRGFFAEAAEVFERATRYDRSHYPAYVGWAEALIVLGRNDEAAAVTQDALERYARNCEIGAARGHVFLHQQDLERAVEFLDIATENAPNNAYVWLVAGEVRLAMRGALTGAMDCFARAREAPDRWHRLDVRIALAFLEWGETEHAARALTAILKAHPNVPLAWLLLGDAHRILGRTRESRDCYRRVAELVPDLPSVRRALSWKARAAETWRGLRKSLGRVLGPP